MNNGNFDILKVLGVLRASTDFEENLRNPIPEHTETTYIASRESGKKQEGCGNVPHHHFQITKDKIL